MIYRYEIKNWNLITIEQKQKKKKLKSWWIVRKWRYGIFRFQVDIGEDEEEAMFVNTYSVKKKMKKK